MAQIYDRFQIDNGHLFAQLIADTLLTRSFKALNRTVVFKGMCQPPTGFTGYGDCIGKVPEK